MKTCLLLTVFLTQSAMHAAELDRCNVVWDSPSEDARGSMPIGNGDIGLNVWVEPSGDLLFFIGKTDAWDENMRLLKLNKVRVKFEPAFDVKKDFRWELKLREGVIEIQDGKALARVWVDANHPVVQVDVKSLAGNPIAATVTLEPWRKEKRPLGSPSQQGGEYFSTGYTTLPAFSQPDTILPRSVDRIGWHHRNIESPWLASLKLQRNEEIASTEKDPILNRTTGGIVRGVGFESVSDTVLKTSKPANELSLRIHVLTRITDTAEQWLAALEQQADAIDTLPIGKRWEEHCQWWSGFWDRSWIFIQGGGMVMPSNSHPWRVGLDSVGGSRFGGKINDPLVFGRALSTEEIAAMAGKPRTAADAAPGEVALAAGCTVAAWIQPAANEAGRILDKCTAGTPDGFTFDTHPGLSLRWIVGNDTMVAPGCLVAGEWQHVAASVDAGKGVRRIYLNGKMIKEERGDSVADRVTRAYALQRWMNACGGRGNYPIKFNGSIFVVDQNDYKHADYRAWGGCYWWQNTRHCYWPMLTAGDFDLIRPLFKFYMDTLPARKAATKNYYGHDGAFYPETMSIWGNYTDQGGLGYGIDREGKPDGLTDNTYVRRYWQSGLEMMVMMLDYHDITQDRKFRDETLVPFATEILKFYDQHWERGSDGKILFDPAQSLETWHGAVNPLPEIAGLGYVIPRLQAAVGKKVFQNILDDLPAMPMSADGKRLMPAAKFWNKANVENPELYAIFPYRVYTWIAGGEHLEIAKQSYAARGHKDNFCWRQDSIQSALLGMADETQMAVIDRTSFIQPGFRFPAMWSAGSDWMPDQDHGGVMMTTLQRMLVQYEGDKIVVMPAWPKNWDASFKLRAPRDTTLEGKIVAGKVTELVVTPESRRKDVVIRE